MLPIREDLNKYLESRNLLPPALEHFEACWGSDLIFPAMYRRLAFPVYDQYGAFVSYIGRTIDAGVLPKYTAIPYNKGCVVYNLDKAKQTNHSFFWLVEGVLDALYVFQCGFDNVLASCGSAISLYQASLIKRYKDTVFIIPDNDKPGLEGAKKSKQHLEMVGVTVFSPPTLPYQEDCDFGDHFVQHKVRATADIERWERLLIRKRDPNLLELLEGSHEKRN